MLGRQPYCFLTRRWNCIAGGSICTYLVVTAVFLGRKWCSMLSFWCSCPRAPPPHAQPQASSMPGKHSTHWVPSQVPTGFFGEYLWFKPWALLTQTWSFKYFKVLLLASFKHFHQPVHKENKRIRISQCLCTSCLQHIRILCASSPSITNET